MAIQARLRKWGNSIGIVIPNDVLRSQSLKEGEEVIVEIERKKSMKELFGSLKIKIDSQKLKDQLRKEWSY